MELIDKIRQALEGNPINIDDLQPLYCDNTIDNKLFKFHKKLEVLFNSHLSLNLQYDVFGKLVMREYSIYETPIINLFEKST